MSKILKSSTCKKKKILVFKCFLMKHFILKLFSQTSHSQLNLYDFSYGKGIKGNANFKSVENITRRDNNHRTLGKNTWIVVVPSWRFHNFRHILLNQKLKLMASFFSPKIATELILS